MELGTGIFLSAVFLGTVALFIATKDRWNWKKIFLWPLAVVVVLTLVGGLAAFVYKQYEERSVVISELKNIKLGEKITEVVFRNGKPRLRATVYVEDIGKILVERKAEKGTAGYSELENLYDYWKIKSGEIDLSKSDGEYILPDGRLTFEIKNEKVENISYHCDSTSADYFEINGIRCGSEGGNLLAKFGNDVRVLCEKEPEKSDGGAVMRVYDVVKFGTRYYLTKNSVGSMMIASPSTLESYMGKSWIPCN